jgi:hypothetical protein
LVTYNIMKQLFNLLLFLVICLLIYIVFRRPSTLEGLENATKDISGITGVAGGAADYVKRLTNAVTQKTDILLIDKYRTDYENAILKADDLINVTMLQEVLSLDTSKPDKNIQTFMNIAYLNQAKDGLNKVMKYVDNAKSSGGGIFG